jgi:capsular exopolysaccharide synthesis family protein
MKNTEITSMDKEFQIDRYWNIIRPRLHILVICVVLALLGGFAKSMSVTPHYRAYGILMIAPEQEGTITFSDRFSIRPNTEYFNTQVRILRSRSLAKRVIEEISDTTFHQLPGDTSTAGNIGNDEALNRRVDRFLGTIQVRPLRDTRLVEVSYTSLDAERAANIVNTLFAKYIDFNREFKSRSTRQASEFINRQMEELQQTLAQKEEELQNYSKSKDLYYLNNEENVEVGKFSDLNRAYTEAQINRINREAVYRELNRKEFEDYPAVRNDQLINQLKSNYANLENSYKRQSQVFKDSYPEMVKIKSQMDALQLRIRDETKTLAEQTLKDAKNQYESALKKEDSLLKLLNQQKEEMVTSNSNAIHYNSLRIEVENMRNLLNFLDRRHKETILVSTNREGAELSNIRVIDPADVPRRAIAPQRKMLLLMALILGLGGGLALIFLLDFMDRTVKGQEDIKTLLGVPTLGVIPASTAKSSYASYFQYLPYKKEKAKPGGIKDIEMINYLDPESPLSESYRNIRTSILLSTAGRPPRIITLSSARPSEGKTATAINLAIAFHQLGKKVLLIDGDMRKPRIHKIFRLKNTVGLSSYLVGRAKWTEIVKKTDIPNLFVIPSGPIPPNPVELLDSEMMENLLLKTASPKYDVIFLDSPPFIDIVDPILLGKLSDGMIMVTWSGKTNRNLVEKAKEKIDQFNIRLLGVVLNKVNLKGEGYGYQYAYQYTTDDSSGTQHMPPQEGGPPPPAHPGNNMGPQTGEKEKKNVDALIQRVLRKPTDD